MSLIRLPDGWGAFVFLLTGLLFVPVFLVLLHLGQTGPKWDHITEHVLGSYTWNTVWVTVSVSIVVLLVGIPTAWLVSRYEFTGRRWFAWLLILPLALPTYVSAFVYYDVVQQAIPLRIWIRSEWGIEAFLASEPIIRNSLLVVTLSSVLFPYVYLACRASFSDQGGRLYEAARSLGKSPRAAFFSVILPMARPAIVAGLALVIMEIINDYGAVHYFGVPTLTEGIFRTWIGHEDRISALKLASIAIVAITMLLVFEKLLRGRARFEDSRSQPLARIPLRGTRSILAVVICLIPLTAGFFYPVWRLASWASTGLFSGRPGRFEFSSEILAGTTVALATAAIVTALAVVFAYAVHLRPKTWRAGAGRIAALGYATPGVVVALGVMATLGAFDRWDLPLPLLSGTFFAIGFAYAVR
ncbi:MAG: ABC transporter permease subunit, partial [Verrucomicrobiota bacterium]